MTERLVERFERQGYVVVPGVVSRDEVERLRSFFLSEMEEKEEFRRRTGSLLDVVVKYPKVFEIFRNRQFRDVLTEILGANFLVVPHSSVALNSFGTFHTDTTAPELDGETFPREGDYRLVTVGIYLQDNSEYGGGLQLVPESHRMTDPYVDLMRRKVVKREKYKRSKIKRFLNRLSRYRLFDYSRPFRHNKNAVSVPSQAGDAIIWDMRLAHSASIPSRRTPLPYGEKLAIFFTCGRESAPTQSYLRWLYALPANVYLTKERSIGNDVQEESRQLGFRVL